MMVLFGVISGLQVAENLIKSKNVNGILHIAIYACEESSRFGNACIGSKYLNGNISEEDFSKIVDQKDKKTTLNDAIEYAKIYLHEHIEGVEEVDKIFDKVDYSLEAHIEQYDLLTKKTRKFFSFNKEALGIITSVGSAVRVKYRAEGKAGHTGSTPMRKRRNAVDAASLIGLSVMKFGKKYEKKGLGRASQVEINTPGHKGSFNQIPKNAEGLIDFRLLGKNEPEKVLKDFERMGRIARWKTGVKIGYTVISKGTPTIMSSELNSKIEEICKRKRINYMFMPSGAGQDSGYIPAKQKTMVFIPSTGGSHDPAEDTTPEAITSATNVFTDLAKDLFKENFKDRIELNTSSSSSSNSIQRGNKKSRSMPQVESTR